MARNSSNRGDFGQGANMITLLSGHRASDPPDHRHRSPMTVHEDEIARLAELARIRIADEQVPALTRRIGDILGMVEQLQATDTEGVEPMTNPLDAVQR